MQVDIFANSQQIMPVTGIASLADGVIKCSHVNIFLLWMSIPARLLFGKDNLKCVPRFSKLENSSIWFTSSDIMLLYELVNRRATKKYLAMQRKRKFKEC